MTHMRTDPIISSHFYLCHLKPRLLLELESRRNVLQHARELCTCMASVLRCQNLGILVSW
jgi:hypothetical protein